MALRVMVVDDALFMRNMLKDIFVRAVHNVVAEAENGEIALELYQ
jgi:two-component system chemotaxis response regulator CheY